MPQIKSPNVPKKLQPKFDEIMALVEPVCDEHLDQEYAELSREMTATLARKRPSPLSSGRANTWAAAIVWTIGRVNFLTDKSFAPYMSAADLAEAFGVGKGTVSSKSGQIWKMLNLMQFDPNWTVASKVDSNPMIWMLSINGFIMDIRDAPREAQEQAFEKGLIPYIPDDQ